MAHYAVILELHDLLECDPTLEKIKVDKTIFDCFVENVCIEIQFVENEHGIARTYKMVSEDNTGIVMELMQ